MRRHGSTGRDDLVARGQQDHTRSADDLGAVHTDGGGDAEMVWAEHGPGCDQRVTGDGIGATRVHGVAGVDRTYREPDRIAAIAQFVADDGVDVVRQGCSGGDRHALARLDPDVHGVAGCDGRRDREGLDTPQVAGPKRVSIQLRPVE